MLVKHPPPPRRKKAHARAQANLTPKLRVTLYGTPEVSQMRAHLHRGPVKEEEAPSRKEGTGPRRSSQSLGLV
ncbi:hypothetical protein O181_019415, partial [Austropuccinia psidii MF-1]|nr:hypothetical protein [Austropuccinia psidii MF-1]